jgi:hypothetical protein
MSNWTEEQIEKVWLKGKEVSGYEKNKHRKDLAGAWMQKDQHGNQDSIFGWQIDHKIPSAKNGCSSMCNLQPLQWNNNQTKSDDFPSFKTSITSENNSNIEHSQSWKYNAQQVSDLKSCCPNAKV